MRVTCLYFVLTIVGELICLGISNSELSLNALSPRGEISQLKYANNKARNNELPVIAWYDSSAEAVILISLFWTGSEMRISTNHNSCNFDNNIFAISTGYAPDCTATYKYINKVIQTEQNELGPLAPSLNKISNSVGKWLTKGLYSHLQSNEDDEEESRTDDVSRPYCVNLFLASYDSIAGKLQLYNIENTGYYRDCDFGCVGKLSDSNLLRIKQIVFSDQILCEKICQILTCLSDYLEANVEDVFNQLKFEVSVVKQSQYTKHILSVTDHPYDNIIK